MRSSFFHFLLLLGCVAVLARYAGRWPAPQRIQRVLLVVSRGAISGSAGQPIKIGGDSLTLEVTEKCWVFFRRSKKEDGPLYRGYWTPAHFESLFRLLEQAGVWQLRDGDGGEPDGQALYTYLEVSDGQRTMRTFWRGPSPPHQRVAEVLLSLPELSPHLGLEIDRLGGGKLPSRPKADPVASPNR